MPTYVSDVTLFDGRTIKRRAGVLVEGTRVAWVGAHARAPREARAAQQLDGTGKTLTPGLIDCHVHLAYDGTADFTAEARELTDALATIKASRNALRHLESGTTTVRDLGGPGQVMCEVARAVDRGLIPGPRVIAAGQALTITGGHGHGMFAREVDGPDEIRRAVREQVRGGARAIKVIATGGVLTPGIGVDFTAFTPEEIQSAVDEAHKWGRPIAAHAIGAPGIASAVAAGIDSVEHGSQITPESARAMKASGAYHVPTISALREMVDHPDEVPSYAVEKAAQILDQARESFRRAARAGVRQACGTDAGTPFNLHGHAPLEIVRMVDWGLTPLKALEAATANAAELLRLEDVGRVAEGAFADLVLYDANPLDAIDALLKPGLVMKAGEIVAGR